MPRRGFRVCYRVDCEVSVRDGPWVARSVRVEAGSPVPSAVKAAWMVKDDLMTYEGTHDVRVRRTRVTVLEPGPGR